MEETHVESKAPIGVAEVVSGRGREGAGDNWDTYAGCEGAI